MALNLLDLIGQRYNATTAGKEDTLLENVKHPEEALKKEGGIAETGIAEEGKAMTRSMKRLWWW